MSVTGTPRLGDPPPPTVRQRFLTLLQGFEIREPGYLNDDDDPELACKACGEVICLAEHGDTLSVLAGMALDHDCPAAEAAPGELPAGEGAVTCGVEAITVARAAVESGEVPVPGCDLITAAMEVLASAGADRRIERLALAGALVALLIDQREPAPPPDGTPRAEEKACT